MLPMNKRAENKIDLYIVWQKLDGKNTIILSQSERDTPLKYKSELDRKVTNVLINGDLLI